MRPIISHLDRKNFLMRLLFLGVSSAFEVGKGKFHSNMLLESETGQKMLIDCGSDARHSLHEQGYTYNDIDAVYISHLHADHAGGLEWLGFCKYFYEQQKPKLYVSSDQINSLWENNLSAGMSTLEHQEVNLSTFFNVQSITDLAFDWEQYTFKLIKTHHVSNNGKLVPSYGLLITTGRQKIFITSDTRFDPDYLDSFYKEADVIFQDCETHSKPSGQHAHYDELKTLDNNIKNKMWLYHYTDKHLPNPIKDGFNGFVGFGQCFHFN